MHPWIKSLAAGTVLTLCLAGQAEAGVVVFADDFESTVNTRNWQVYQDVSSGQWATTQGTGIEVQTSGTVVAAQSGNQYIELDSSRSRGGAGDASLTNSAMTVTLTDLDAGDYLLNYFYQPRTNTADDNIIGVYFDEGDDPLFSTLVDTANGVGADGWVERSVSLSVAEQGAMRQISFRAEGIQNSLGGFVDTVSLSYMGNPGSVPEPLGLAFIGLAGLGFAGRRRRRA